MADRPRGRRPDPTRVAELFERYGSGGSRSVRNELVELHIGLAYHIARRYSRTADQRDDLEQVAVLGLVKAVERFDPSRGVGFGTFAGRTVEGELKRHFRDATWEVRVPRSLKDLHVSVRSVSDELTNRFDRAPSIGEIAEELDVDRDTVIEALGAGNARNPQSIDAPSGPDGATPAASLGIESDYTRVEDRFEVEQLTDTLEPREREIIRLRYEERMSQDAIAELIGISQMHVSRLLRRSLETLRAEAETRRPAS